MLSHNFLHKDQCVKTDARIMDYYINYIVQLNFLVMINIWLLST